MRNSRLVRMVASYNSRGVALLLLCSLAVVLTGCPEEYEPVIDPANFVAGVTNPFDPLLPGTTFVYKAESAEGTQVNTVKVLHNTKDILGVTCTIVHDIVTVDGVLTEDAIDWFAQDKDGNVWYFGEESNTIEDGVVVSTEGSWEAGVDGALPGIVMEGNPLVGDTYRQEYLKGTAEDMARVESLTESATVPYGAFTNCLETTDYSGLDAPGTPPEHKFFSSGVGLLLTLDGDVRLELVSKTTS